MDPRGVVGSSARLLLRCRVPHTDSNLGQFHVVRVLLDSDVLEAFQHSRDPATAAPTKRVEDAPARRANEPGKPLNEFNGLEARMPIGNALRKIPIPLAATDLRAVKVFLQRDLELAHHVSRIAPEIGSAARPL